VARTTVSAPVERGYGQFLAGTESGKFTLALQRSQRLCDWRSHQASLEMIIWHEGEWRCELWSDAGRSVLRVFCGPDLRHEETHVLETDQERAQQLRQLVLTAVNQDEPFTQS
jgi:hypothetical protein